MKEILDHFSTDEEKLREWRWFVGPDADYYLESWVQIKNGHVFIFNIYAFIFNILWMLHRQLFRPAILFLSVFFAEGYLEKLIISQTDAIILPPWWTGIRVFIFAVALGFLGNWIYLKHTENTITQIKKKYQAERHQAMIRVKGGTSFIPVVLFIVILLSILLVNYFYKDMGMNYSTVIR